MTRRSTLWIGGITYLPTSSIRMYRFLFSPVSPPAFPFPETTRIVFFSSPFSVAWTSAAPTSAAPVCNNRHAQGFLSCILPPQKIRFRSLCLLLHKGGSRRKWFPYIPFHPSSERSVRFRFLIFPRTLPSHSASQHPMLHTHTLSPALSLYPPPASSPGAYQLCDRRNLVLS